MFSWFVLNLLIGIGNWTGKIRFGLGLGDLIYMVIIGLAILFAGIYYLRDLKLYPGELLISKYNLMAMILCLAFLAFLILKMTYLRGWESRWDGRIFF